MLITSSRRGAAQANRCTTASHFNKSRKGYCDSYSKCIQAIKEALRGELFSTSEKLSSPHHPASKVPFQIMHLPAAWISLRKGSLDLVQALLDLGFDRLGR